jgi:hypothetical protein
VLEKQFPHGIAILLSRSGQITSRNFDPALLVPDLTERIGLRHRLPLIQTSQDLPTELDVFPVKLSPQSIYCRNAAASRINTVEFQLVLSGAVNDGGSSIGHEKPQPGPFDAV